MPDITTLPRRQQEAIPLLMGQTTIRDVAKKLAIHEKTIFRWMHEKPFQAVYRDARRIVMHEAFDKLQKLCSESVEVLAKVMRDETVAAGTRVHAATSILSIAFRTRSFEDLDARLAALEAHESLVRASSTTTAA